MGESKCKRRMRNSAKTNRQTQKKSLFRIQKDAAAAKKTGLDHKKRRQGPKKEENLGEWQGSAKHQKNDTLDSHSDSRKKGVEGRGKKRAPSRV